MSVSSVKRMETAPHRVADDLREIVRIALERAGATFLDDDGLGAGVKVRKVSSGEQH